MGESYRKPTRPQADGAGNQYEIAFSDETYDNTGGAIAHGAGQRCERNHETHFGKAQHEVLFNERKNKHEYANVPVAHQMTKGHQDQCFRSMQMLIFSIHAIRILYQNLLFPFCGADIRIPILLWLLAAGGRIGDC